MYLIFDLDDTLLTSDKKITNFTKNILKKAQDLGHLVVINSARGFEFMQSYIKEIKADYTIANGGSEIYKNEELIYFDGISKETVNEIISDFKEHDVTDFTVQTLGKLYTSSLSYANGNIYATYFNFNNPFLLDACKVVFKSNDKDFSNSLSKKYSLTLTNYLNGEWYRLSKTTKQNGNINLFKLLNDTNPQAIVFGDDIGDLEMLQAYHGVALKNSVNEVLAKVPNITEFTNNEDGCAKYIENLFKKGIL